ncbi:MAG: HlyD family efflux transporter periplasmic adaptor subunit [Gemmataceae bacterium]|nr:HlyD family efflux transporter periplasmic adaptor subunit [Gemmataceae bacterium]
MNRFLWLLMVVLLVGTAVGASLAFNNGNPFGKAAPKTKADNPAPPMVVALGLVDGDPSVAKPLPLVPGRIVEVIAEGTEVKKGDPLLKLDDRMYQATVDEAKAALDEAVEKLTQAKDLPEQHRLKQEQQQKAIAAAEAERKSAKFEQDFNLNKAKGGLEVNKNLLASLEERLKQLDAKVAGEQARLDELRLFRPKSEIARAQADVNAKQAQLAKAQWALEQCTLQAPSDGLILRVTATVGEVIQTGIPGQPAPIQFLPKGVKVVRAEVLQEWASLVQAGQDVDIEDDTYQGPVWKGRIRSLSNWFAEKRHRIIEPFMINDVRTLECMVEVLDESPPLRIGQRVRVKIKTK